MKIALLGYGTVGTGVFELVEKNREKVKKRFDKDLEVVKILDLRIERFADLPHADVFTENFEDVVNSDANVVIEMLGGVNPAYKFTKASLESGKSVITSNKDLIAEHGDELRTIAREKGVRLSYEAAVGGGIPVLKPMRESLFGNTLDSLEAIINGTTNFILTKMYSENMGYAEALKIAQDLGFAEADPSSDVKGWDAARKLSILTDLGFNDKFNWKDIYCEGIEDIDGQDIANAKNMKSKIKLLAFTKVFDEKLYAAVRPVIVGETSTLGKIDNEFNGVIINGDAVGEVLFYGKGAGKLPTASAVFGDLMDVILEKAEFKLVEPVGYEHVKKYPAKASWLVRVDADDINTATGKLFELFNKNKVEMASFLSEGEIALKVSGVDEFELDEKLTALKEKGELKSVKYFLVKED